MWFVYILECSDGTFYTGITTDPDRRLKQHNAGTASKYTRGRLPIKKMHIIIERESKSAALRLEAEIKKYSRKEKKKLFCQE